MHLKYSFFELCNLAAFYGNLKWVKYYVEHRNVDIHRNSSEIIRSAATGTGSAERGSILNYLLSKDFDFNGCNSVISRPISGNMELHDYINYVYIPNNLQLKDKHPYKCKYCKYSGKELGGIN